MKLAIDKNGYAEYVWTTNDGWEITQKMYEELLDICPVLNHGEILRLVDLFKSNEIQKAKK